MGEVIVFLSGKGGTGKTSLCAGIATALANMGEKVLCIDCDIGLRNLDIALAMAECPALSFKEVYEGDYDLDLATVHPKFPSLYFLTAPVSGTAEEIDLDTFGAFLRKARQRYNYIFLDAPAGVDAGFRLAATYADQAIVVTMADPASMRDAARTGEILELMGKKNIRLIVNRVDEALYSAIKFTVDDVIDRTALQLLGIVPNDYAVVLAAAMEKPLIKSTKHGAASACRRIAKRIQGYRVPVTLK